LKKAINITTSALKTTNAPKVPQSVKHTSKSILPKSVMSSAAKPKPSSRRMDRMDAMDDEDDDDFGMAFENNLQMATSSSLRRNTL